MKLGQLMTVRCAFVERLDNKMAPSLAYKIMKFLKDTDRDADFFRIRAMQIIEQHGEFLPDGRVKMKDRRFYGKTPEAQMAIYDGLAELENVKVKAPKLALKLDEIQSLRFSVAEMAALDDFIVE